VAHRHAAFASILWAPPAEISDGGRFDDLLRAAPQECLLLNGATDPWITPPFGRAAYRALAARTVSARLQLIELSPCGHCPNHEAPRAVATLVGRWLRGEEPLGASGEAAFAEASGQTVRARRLASSTDGAAGEVSLSPWERALTSIMS